MPATYLGSHTIGGAVVGLASAFATVGGALEHLRTTVEAQVTALADARAAVAAQATAALTARAAIRVPAVIDLQALLDASLEITANLSAQLGDPAAYLSGLLAGLVQVEANIGALDPVIALQGQLDANAGVAADLSGKIAAIDLELDALVTLSAALDAVVAAHLAIQAALNAALNVIGPALDVFASMTATLGAAGAHVFRYDGTIADMGAAIDAVSGDAGLAGSVTIRTFLVFVQTSDPSLVAALNATVRVS
jgi:hypothetical protein